MDDHDRVLALIDRIYAAAADFSLWPVALREIADAFDAREAAIGGAGCAPWLVAPPTDPLFLKLYGEHLHALNLFGQKAAAPGPDGGLRRGEFLDDRSTPQGDLAAMGSTLLVEDGCSAAVQVPGAEAFDDRRVRLYRALSPHLARAVELMRRLRRAEGGGLARAELLEGLPQAALLVDGACRVLHANGRSEPFFASGALRLKDGVLVPAEPVSGGPLEALVGGCARREVCEPGGAMTIGRGGGRGAPLTVLVAPVRGETPGFDGHDPAAIVFVTDPEAPTAERVARLKARYGLTEAEAAFAVEIVKGDGKAAAASRRGVTFATARTHLSRIFEKTGVRRQAELVRLLLEDGV